LAFWKKLFLKFLWFREDLWKAKLAIWIFFKYFCVQILVATRFAVYFFLFRFLLHHWFQLKAWLNPQIWPAAYLPRVGDRFEWILQDFEQYMHPFTSQLPYASLLFIQESIYSSCPSSYEGPYIPSWREQCSIWTLCWHP
jgi:hypothetical protein